MNVALRRPITVAEFLAWEERQPVKYEFDGFQPIGMLGVTLAHAIIQANLLGALTKHLAGKPCRPLGSDLKLRAAGRIRYPNAQVLCTAMPGTATVVTEPAVVSRSSAQAANIMILS